MSKGRFPYFSILMGPYFQTIFDRASVFMSFSPQTLFNTASFRLVLLVWDKRQTHHCQHISKTIGDKSAIVYLSSYLIVDCSCQRSLTEWANNINEYVNTEYSPILLFSLAMDKTRLGQSICFFKSQNSLFTSNTCIQF